MSQDFAVPILFSSSVLLVSLHTFFLCPALTGPTCSLLTSISCCTCIRCAQLLPFPCTPFVLTPFSALILLVLFACFGLTRRFWPCLPTFHLLKRCPENAPSAVSSFVAGTALDMRPQPVGVSLSTDEIRWACQVQSNTKSARGNNQLQLAIWF